MADAAVDRLARQVTVTGIARSQFVEFRFALGDPDLTVDLVMPPHAFAQFCAREQAEVCMADAAVAAAFRALDRG